MCKPTDPLHTYLLLSRSPGCQRRDMAAVPSLSWSRHTGEYFVIGAAAAAQLTSVDRQTGELSICMQLPQPSRPPRPPRLNTRSSSSSSSSKMLIDCDVKTSAHCAACHEVRPCTTTWAGLPPEQISSAHQVSNKCIAVRKVATPLRELTCHMG